jgi:hypothetical protein
MRGARMASGTMLVLVSGIAPAVALSESENERPRIVSATAVADAGREVRVVLVGRDRDDVVRGADITWGQDEPAQGLSACEQTARSQRADRRRRGRKARFEFSHSYAAGGDYAVTVRVLSGGCGDRPQQSSPARTLAVHVE